MDLHAQRTPLDAPGIPEIDGELASRSGPEGQLEVEVIEHLRVKVPAAARQAWLEAEAASWEPWLQGQPGFLGRELHWDRERQEGQLLIRWASREQWHAIPRDQIDAVQEHFERLAHAALERLGVVSLLEAMADADPVTADLTSGSEGAGVQAPAGAQQATPPNPFPLVYAGELPPDAHA